MKMPDDYQVPDDPDTGRMDAAYLRTKLGLPADGQLPLAVRQAHYDVARSMSLEGRMGRDGIGAEMRTLVYVLALRDGIEPQEPEKTKRSFLDESPTDGQKVVIHWRKKDQAAHFLSMTPEKRVRVLHNGNEVKMRSDLVRHAEPHEFPDVADNIYQTAEA